MHRPTLCAAVCLAIVGSGAISLPAAPTAADGDYRDMANGRLMYTAGYMDQPYCVVTEAAADQAARSRWVCIVTLNDAHEGSAGEHMASFWTEDQGQTWTGPTVVNPDLVAAGIDNSYGMVLVTEFGRIVAVSNANLDNITKLPGGKSISRTDELGYFIAKHSDDHGTTWESGHQILPFRQTAVDRNNSFNGKTDIFWSVDQFKSRGSSVYAMFTKIGTYMQSPPEEGFVISSPNVLTERNASQVVWEMLPEGDHGPGCPANFPRASTVAEEWHILPLVATSGFYAVFRTNVGILGASWTGDPTAKAGWVPSTYAAFAPVLPLPASLPGNETMALKNPRGPITLKRFSDNTILMLWYNNALPGFASTGNRNSRNPYFLSAGWETEDGRVEFSQPELILYNRTQTSVRGPGYPDFIEDTDGSLWISETQKVSTRVHRVPTFLRVALAHQNTNAAAFAHNVSLRVDGTPGSHAIPPSTFRDLRDLSSSQAPGYTVELWVENHSAAKAGDVLLSSQPGGAASPGIRLTVGVSQALTFSIGDGTMAANLTTDHVCTAALLAPGPHSVAWIVDGGPNIIMAVVDGKLCDGGLKQYWGFSYIPVGFGSASAATLHVAPQYSGQVKAGVVYGVPLLVSQAVGNARAGPSPSAP